MKRLVISRGKGTTLSLKTQKYYNRSEAAAAGFRERGTHSIYVGSFNSSLDPRRLDGVERIGQDDADRYGVALTGAEVDGRPFELEAGDIDEIRAWLLVNGSWAKTQKSLERLRAEEERLKTEERARMEMKLREELTAELLPQLHAQLVKDVEARRAHPLVEALRAVEAAGEAVRNEASRLVLTGHRMTTRRGRAASGDDGLVNELLEMSLALRIRGFAGFEEACKAAGIMAGRKARSVKQKGAKPR
jgi:hypothetical protein